MNAIILFVLAIVASASCKPLTDSAVTASSRDVRPAPTDALVTSNHLPLYDDDDDEEALFDLSEEADALEDELGAQEGMEGAESVVFRPLFAHRKREARLAAARRNRRARASERGSSFVPYQRAYRRFRPHPRPAYLRPNREDPPLQILY